MREKVALCGFAPATRMLYPATDPTVDLWTLNEARPLQLPHIEAMFQMHERWCWDPNTRDPQYIEWMKAQAPAPVYMFEKEPDIPNSERYPMEEVIARFGHEGKGYLTSTFSYMLALAMLHGYKEIQIFGIDLVAEEEYRYQRAGTEYLMGFAKGMGIKIVIPELCPLLKAPLYGKFDPKEARTLWTEEQIGARINALNQQKAQLLAQVNAVEGALQENGNWRNLHLQEKHSHAGSEYQRFAGIDTVQDGGKVTSDGHESHTGLLEPVVV